MSFRHPNIQSFAKLFVIICTPQLNLSVARSAQLCKDSFCFYFQNQSISAFSDAPIINWAEYARNKDSHDNSRESEGGNSAIIFFVCSVRKAGLAKRCATFYGTLVSALFSVALFEPRPGPYLKCFVIVFAGIFVLSSLSDEKVIFFSFLFPLIFQEIIFLVSYVGERPWRSIQRPNKGRKKKAKG